MLEGAAITDRLGALGELLVDGEPFWSARPFYEHEAAWESTHPELARWARAQPLEALFEMQADPTRAAGPEPWPRLAARVHPLIQLDRLPAADAALAPRERGVKHRKWSQVRDFLAVVRAEAQPATDVVEWCSGKGHLGRTVARHLHAHATLIERDPSLCEAPSPEAHHVCCDARAVDAERDLPPSALHLSLHACGTLTELVLERAAARRDPVIAAPCCFHKLIEADRWRPGSLAESSRGLAFDTQVLRLATREATHAPPRRARLRRREMIARAAWDLLRREATGVNEHHGFPPILRSRFDQPLLELLQELSAALNEPLPPIHPESLSKAAAERARSVQALELPRTLYRRALELYIDLDRAQRLLERGATVRVGIFCEVEATPRNVAIAARFAVGAPGSTRAEAM